MMGVVIGDRECHDAPILERMLGLAPGKQSKKLFDWILGRD